MIFSDISCCYGCTYGRLLQVLGLWSYDLMARWKGVYYSCRYLQPSSLRVLAALWTILLNSLLYIAYDRLSRFIFVQSVMLFNHAIFALFSSWFLTKSLECDYLNLFRSSYASWRDQNILAFWAQIHRRSYDNLATIFGLATILWQLPNSQNIYDNLRTYLMINFKTMSVNFGPWSLYFMGFLNTPDELFSNVVR